MISNGFVVIGGGVIGLSTAYQLALKRVGQVTLLDKGPLGDGSSSRAAGIGAHFVWSDTGVPALRMGERQPTDESRQLAVLSRPHDQIPMVRLSET